MTLYVRSPVRPRHSALECWNEGSGVKDYGQLIQRLRLGLPEGHNRLGTSFEPREGNMSRFQRPLNSCLILNYRNNLILDAASGITSVQKGTPNLEALFTVPNIEALFAVSQNTKREVLPLRHKHVFVSAPMKRNLAESHAVIKY
jgi:hypothetical protein